MTSRPSWRERPPSFYQNTNGGGYEYIRPDPDMSAEAAPPYYDSHAAEEIPSRQSTKASRYRPDRDKPPSALGREPISPGYEDDPDLDRDSRPRPRSRPRRRRSPSPEIDPLPGRPRRLSPEPLVSDPYRRRRRPYDRDHEDSRDKYHPPPSRRGRPSRPSVTSSMTSRALSPPTREGTARSRRAYSASPSPPPPYQRTTGDERARGRDAQDRPSGPASPRRPDLRCSKTTRDREFLPEGLLKNERFQKAAAAAFEAGSMTALNLRKQPGAWAGEKGARIATAALGAAAVDAFTKSEQRKEDRKRDRPSPGSRGGGGGGSGGMKEVGSALAGLVAQHLVKGVGKKSRR